MDKKVESKVEKKEEAPKKVRKYPKIFQIKKDKVDVEALNIVIKFSLVILSLTLIVFLGWFLSVLAGPLSTLLSIAAPFIIAVALAWVIQPIYLRLEKKTKKKYLASGVSVLLLVSVLLIMVIGIGLMLGTTITQEISVTLSGRDLIMTCLKENSACSYLTNTSGTNRIVVQNADQAIIDFIGIGSSQLDIVVSRVLAIVGRSFYYVLIIITTMIYLLPIMNKISGIIKKSIPKKYREVFSDIFDIGTDSFVGYMGGTIKDSVIVGGMFMVGIIIIAVVSNVMPGNILSLFKVTGSLNSISYVIFALLSIGLFIAVTNIVPLIGPFIGGIPVVLLVFLTEQFTGFPYYTLAVALLILIIQQLDGNVIKPIILGGIAKLDAIVVLFSLTFFGSIFGILGFLIATPVVAMTKRVIGYLDELYDIF